MNWGAEGGWRLAAGGFMKRRDLGRKNRRFCFYRLFSVLKPDYTPLKIGLFVFRLRLLLL